MWISIKVSNGKSTSELNLNLLYSLILLSTLPKVVLSFVFISLLISSSINFHNLSKTLITSLLFSSTTKYLSLDPYIFSIRPNRCLTIKYKGLILLILY